MTDLPILGLTRRVMVVDAETASPVNLPAKGQYQYWAHPESRTLMLAAKELYGNEVHFTDFERGADMPPALLAAIRAPKEECLLAAANAPFDQAALRERGYDTPDDKWIDVLVMAYALCFSGRLADVLSQTPLNIQKNPDGQRLITLFSVNREPWHHHPDKWEKFCNYCRQDADVEEQLLRWCLRALNRPWMQAFARKVHRQDLIYRRVNRRGIPVDLDAVTAATRIRASELELILERMADLTGLDNPNSRDQLLEWCNDKGSLLSDLTKTSVAEEIERLEAIHQTGTKLYTILRCRQEIGKSSTSKFPTLLELTSPGDSRFRGGWQFYGASRTGRVAGRGINPANLGRPQIDHAELVAELLPVPQADALLKGLYPDRPILDTLASTVRASLKAPEGKQWTVCDLTSIESVGAAWLAGCDRVLELFHSGRDTYTHFAAETEGVPYESISKATRTFYKPVVLGGIYRMSGHALVDYARSMGITVPIEDAHKQVKALRASWHEIPHYWDQLQGAVESAMENKGVWFKAKAVKDVYSEEHYGNKILRLYSYKDWPFVAYMFDGAFLYCKLPSGRFICYFHPSIEPVTITPREGDPFTVNSLHFYGNNQKLPGARWQKISVHSGHKLENINQAMCRDAMWTGLELAEADPVLEVVGDVYDEIWSLSDIRREDALDRLLGHMTTKSNWMDDLFYLGGEGFSADRQKKG